jgi:DeoR/GlpR family transcriptional regulator of sugar metabolism
LIAGPAPAKETETTSRSTSIAFGSCMPSEPASDPPLAPRQAALLRLVGEQGFGTVEGLARRFGVSTQTVRRDIIALTARGLLQRFHGGAGPAGAVRLGHAEKSERQRTAKASIGAAAAARIPQGASLFLGVGTTAEASAVALATRSDLRVFTNNMQAALRLAEPDGPMVRVLGGTLWGADGSLVGGEAVRALSGLALDIAVIACSGFDATGAPCDFDPEKILQQPSSTTPTRSSTNRSPRPCASPRWPTANPTCSPHHHLDGGARYPTRPGVRRRQLRRRPVVCGAALGQHPVRTAARRRDHLRADRHHHRAESGGLLPREQHDLPRRDERERQRKEPLGPVVRHGDQNWGDIVRWVRNGMIEAEELGVNSENLQEMLRSTNPNIKRLLGVQGNIGEGMGLPADFMARVIRHLGNHGEVSERHVGARTPVGIPRERSLDAL